MLPRGILNNAEFPKITPSQSKGSVSANISFPFRHLNYSFTINVPLSLYTGAKNSSKTAMIPERIGDIWLLKYYQSFALDKNLTEFYSELLKPFRKIRFENNLDDDEYLELITAYVQSIPYDTEKVASIDKAPRFPVETAVDGTGICSDKSVLLAGLLSHEGYAVSILHFAKENHAAVGIKVADGYDFMSCGYAFIETTVISFIGTSESKYAVCRTRPKVFKIGHGTKTYGAISETVKILKKLSALEEKISPESDAVNEIFRLKDKIEAEKSEIVSSKKDIDLCADAEKIKIHNKKVLRLQKDMIRYNELVEDYNACAKLAAFISHNRLDRKAVSKKLKETDL
ncbi:MAG: hypothetical protein Q4Q53_02290 [Methanocorpusculum sp.]|nr:hypothetical protein [Methanocorpusculum sp.]